MNPRLIALAALAAIGGNAYAQSNVTLYGEIEAGVGRRYADPKTVMTSNYDGTSRWGVRGTEDLGNGLKAIFNLESDAIDTTAGLTNSPGFVRQSWVGLSGGFGTLMLGRSTTPQNRVMGTFDLNGTADGSSALKALDLAANGSLTGSRRNGLIQYASPSLSGFSFNVGYSLKANGAAGSKNWMQFAGTYKAKALTLGLSVQNKIADTANDRTGYALGAKYDFGGFVVSGLYTQDEKRLQGKGWGLGVAVPLGSASVGVQVARVSGSSAAARKGAAAWELFADYKLSKRTRLYANVGGVNDKAHAAIIGAANKDTTFALGINHSF